ncbi:DUF4426 domain-containing protein [Lysobacter cavernae]|uniref:DUF4426 domain-containing protein n=1 Tax=Lysobacter cavernae TaxID=1685901 RepID=A0ABV7RQJ9_9GAMM
MRLPLAALSLLLALTTACSREASTPVATSASAQQEAVTRIGDVSIRASVMQTSTLSPAIARQYDIARADTTVMLLVAVRQGPEAQEVSLPARITATATDLRGRRHAIELRELRSGGLLDYVGTVAISPPETLRFDLAIVRDGGAASTMQFSREFFPR